MHSQGTDFKQSYNRFGDERKASSQHYASRNVRQSDDVHIYEPPFIQRSSYQSRSGECGGDYIASDQAFVAVANAILDKMDVIFQSTQSVRETSVSTALQLQNIMSMKELIGFDSALKLRLRKFGPPHRSMSPLQALVHHCDATFGAELAQLTLQKGSTSSVFRSVHSNHHVSREPFNNNGFPSNHHNSHEKGIDLTNHIIDDDNYDSFNASSHSFDFMDMKKEYTCPTASTSSDDLDEDEVYAINQSDIKSNLSQNSPRNETVKSPGKVRFDKSKDQQSRNLNHRAVTPTIMDPNLSAKRSEVKVIAPATLPEGFTFEAWFGNEVFVVVVPPGGVKKGEPFISTKMDIDAISIQEPSIRIRRKVDMKTPIGYWRHSIFDCFRYGIFHTSLMNSIFFPHVALAQVMARMKLNSAGNRSKELRSRARVSTFIFIPSIIIGLNILMLFFVIRGYFLHLQHSFSIFLYSCIVFLCIDIIAIVYFFRLVIKTRRQVRIDFNIPVESTCEDGCLSVFCTPCVITQMRQHTADYATYAGHCCSDTGLSRHIEIQFPEEICCDQEYA